MRDKPPFRADHVGSLLRPDHLLGMRARAKAGDVGAAELRSIEDECIRDVVRMQEAVGLQSVTDGEYRRESFHGDFIGQIEGVEFKQLFTPGGPGSGQHQAPFVAVVSEKMRLPNGGIEIANFRYVNSLTARTAKQTIPSPTMTHFRGGREAIDEEAYPEMNHFFADLAQVYRDEIMGLADAGCRYLQMDDTNLAYLCDDEMRAQAKARGENLVNLLHDYAHLINESIAGRPEDMAVCVHMCRGNARSRWFAEGSYDPIAEIIFNEMNVDGFFMEYDDDRSGDFSPLRFVPKDKMIVLGLVTTKTGELEDRDVIRRRIDQAGQFLDMEQICLSPQCGFASVSEGNLLSEPEQKAKLAMIVELAAEIWG